MVRPYAEKVSKPNPLILVDRDGVIDVCNEGDYVRYLSDFREIPESIEALHLLRQLGCVGIVTNQAFAGDEYGNIIPENYNHVLAITRHINQQMNQRFQMGVPLPTFICHHKKDFGCGCRKPEPGMVYQAIGYFRRTTDNNIFIIGDHYTDILAGRKAGLSNIYPLLVRTGRGSDEETTQFFIEHPGLSPLETFDNLMGASEFILDFYKGENE